MASVVLRQMMATSSPDRRRPCPAKARAAARASSYSAVASCDFHPAPRCTLEYRGRKSATRSGHRGQGAGGRGRVEGEVGPLGAVDAGDGEVVADEAHAEAVAVRRLIRHVPMVPVADPQRSVARGRPRPEAPLR